MKALILSAPSKSTDDVNWTEPLNSYLLSVYGNTSEFQDDLLKFTALRKSVQGASAAADNNPRVDLFLDYYSQLELVDLRVPMLIVNKRKPLKFTWNDAFAPGVEHTQSALPYEKASVLFNLGSALMKSSALKYGDSFRSSGSSHEESEKMFKEAFQVMQEAAGVFQYLSESFLNGPSEDLKPSTVKFLVNLCLAQSQEMFTLKVIDGDLEQRKNSLISKLCASAAKFYEECHKETAHLVNDDGVSLLGDQSDFGIHEAGFDDEFLTLGEDGDEGFSEYDPEASNAQSTRVKAQVNASWVAIFKVKHLYYKSLAYYFQGLQLETGNKFGDAIAYLTKASELLGGISLDLLRSASKSRGHNVYNLLDNIEYQKDASRIKLADLTKDNDLIYHDIVPSLVTLAEPKALNSSKVYPMSKIEAFAQINEINYNHFLNHVVPVSIHELLSCYSEEKSQFLRNELDAIDVSNEELSSALEYLNLPKALVSIKELFLADMPLEHGGLDSHLDPESLRKVMEILSKFAQDCVNRNNISHARKIIFECVAKSEGLLASAPSITSQGQFRDDLIKLKQSLYDAANSDSRLFALIDQENSGFYQTLGKGVDSSEFKHLFLMPEIDKDVGQSQVPEVSFLDMDDSQLSRMSVTLEDKIARLEDLFNDLNIVKSNKARLISELKKEIHNDDISDILLINSRAKSTNEIKTIIFSEELKKFDAYLINLNKFIDKEKSLMSEIKKFWEELISSPKIKSIQTSSAFRNGLINEQKSKISGFYENNWRKYTVGLQKGVGFYQQLLDYAKSLQNAIERQTQTGLLTQSMGSFNLERDATGGSSNAYTSQVLASPGLSVKTQQGWDAGAFARQGQSQGQQACQQLYTNDGSLSAFPTGSNASLPSAPQLPPKRPSQTSVRRQNDSLRAASSQEAGAQQAKPAPQFGTSNRASGKESGLIYDKPSAYQPNMYDYFAQNRD